MPFEITLSLHERFVKTKESFCCPLGHSQSYVGETEEQKLLRIIRERNEEIRKKNEIIAELNAKLPKRKRKTL